MNSLFKKIKQWIITYQADIILFIGVILISLLSFALGFILAKQQEKEPIRIEQIPTNYEFFRITNSFELRIANNVFVIRFDS